MTVAFDLWPVTFDLDLQIKEQNEKMLCWWSCTFVPTLVLLRLAVHEKFYGQVKKTDRMKESNRGKQYLLEEILCGKNKIKIIKIRLSCKFGCDRHNIFRKFGAIKL